jgi:hypothetical protein
VVLLCLVILGIGAAYFSLHAAALVAKPIPIADIDSWLNYASVWIEGTVISGPRMNERSISFDVQDESGESLEVNIYFKPWEIRDKIPMVGDRVKVFGMLRVFMDGSMQLRVSKLGVDEFTGEEKFQVTRAQAVEATIRELTYDWPVLRHRRVILRGTITGMRPLAAAKIYTLENLENKDHSVSLYIHNGLRYAENRGLDLRLLQEVEVTAGVSEYGGSPQLAIASYGDIRVIGGITHENLMANISDIATIFENNIKRVNGLLLESIENLSSAFENIENEFNTFSSGLENVVKSYEGYIEDLVAALENENVGSVLEFLASVKNIDPLLNDLKSKVDAFLEEAENRVSETALDNLERVKNRCLVSGAYAGEVYDLLWGKFVRIKGQIIFVEMEGEEDSLEIEKRRFWLDGEDNPYIWVWESVYELLPENARELLRRGSAAEFTGRISDHGGLAIELVAPPELDLKEGLYELPTVENLEEIGSDNVGQFVRIVGRLIGVEEIPKALIPGDRELVLQDDFGGTITVRVSSVIYERIPEKDLPSIDDTLRVVGRVDENGGEIKVLPGVPADLEVI